MRNACIFHIQKQFFIVSHYTLIVLNLLTICVNVIPETETRRAYIVYSINAIIDDINMNKK